MLATSVRDLRLMSFSNMNADQYICILDLLAALVAPKRDPGQWVQSVWNQ